MSFRPYLIACTTTAALLLGPGAALAKPRVSTTPPPPPPPTTTTTTATATAANYYVAVAGSDTNPGTQTQPFRTLNKAYQVAGPGHVVEVTGGVYGAQTINPDSTHTSSTDVTFKATPGATVQIGAKGGSPWEPLTVTNANHITFDGLSVTRPAITAADITFRNFKIECASISGSDQISFINGEITKPTTACGVDDGVFAGVASGGNTNNDHLFDNVYWHDVERPDNNPSGHTDCLQYTQVNGLIVRNSRFIRCDDASIIAKADQGSLRNITIENNWFDKGICGLGGPNMELDGGACDPANFEVGLAGNSADDSCTAIIRYNSINDKQRSITCIPPSLGAFAYYGNIVREMTNTSCKDTHPNVALNRNMFIIDDLSASPCGTNTRVGDPLWVNGTQNAASMNLHLQAGSPAMSASIGVPCVVSDFDRETRPTTSCDLGADER